MGKPSGDEQNRSEAEIDYQYGSPQGERSESNLIGGRQSRKSWHNTAKSRHSALEVNEAFGWWRITFLPGEISSTCGRSNAAARSSVMADVIGEKPAEVIVVGTTNRSARLHSKIADFTPTKDRTKTMKRPEHPSITMKPTGGVKNGYGIRAEKETSCVETEFPKGLSVHVRHHPMA